MHTGAQVVQASSSSTTPAWSTSTGIYMTQTYRETSNIT